MPALIDQPPTPLDPLVLADTYWSQYAQRITFEEINSSPASAETSALSILPFSLCIESMA